MKLKRLFEDMANMMQQPQKVDDHEATMAIADLKQLAEQASELAQKIQSGEELEGWVQSKITKASDYIQAVYKYYHYNPETGSDGDCTTCGDMKETTVPKLALGDMVFTSMDNLVSSAKKLNKPENYSVLSDTDGKKIMLTTNQRAAQFEKEGKWMMIGKIDPNGNFRKQESTLFEAASTCCGRCGHKHVKGTSCPKPYLTGKRHCRNRK